MSEDYWIGTSYSHCPKCGQPTTGGQTLCGHSIEPQPPLSKPTEDVPRRPDPIPFIPGGEPWWYRFDRANAYMDYLENKIRELERELARFESAINKFASHPEVAAAIRELGGEI